MNLFPCAACEDQRKLLRHLVLIQTAVATALSRIGQRSELDTAKGVKLGGYHVDEGIREAAGLTDRSPRATQAGLGPQGGSTQISET